MTEEGPRRPGLFPSLGLSDARIHDALALALCAVALMRAAWLTSDLSWPFGTDQLRDIAFAESFARGEWLSDPFFLHEWLWYPPLLPWAVGAASVIAGVPASMADVRLGPYLNIFSPLALYALTALWFGRRAALASLVAFLFLDRGPYWLEPTYTPWLLSGPSSQAILYVGLIALTRAISQQTRRHWALVGVLLGLAALGHSAPAVLLGVLAAGASLIEAVTRGRPLRSAENLLLTSSVAAVVCSPFLVSIVGHYGLRIRNPAGLLWVDPVVNASAWGLLSDGRWTLTLFALAMLGLLSRPAWLGAANRGRGLAISWLTLSLVMFAVHQYEVTMTRAGHPIGLPLFSPPHHFLYYLRAGLLVSFGAGFVMLSEAIARLARHRAARGGGRNRPKAVFALLLGMLLLVSGAEWSSRADFTLMVRGARDVGAPLEWQALTRWMRTRTSPTDVFFAADDPALSIVGATGRKVVALDRFFANPYVDVQPRLLARQMYWNALASGDCAAARQLALRYGATHVVHARSPEIPPGTCGLETVFEIPGVRVDQIRD